jgi:CRP/FNR family transcriptional regulator, nitrogen fixation regulation protein
MLTHATVHRITTDFSLTRNRPTASPDVPDEECSSHALDDLMHQCGATMFYSRKAEIYSENTIANHLYKVIRGAVCTCKFLSDGRRQIGGFYLASDILGLEQVDKHALSAEAITDVEILVIKKNMLLALAGRDVAIVNQLLCLTALELAKAQKRTLLLFNCAQERVAAFLLDLAKRTSAGDSLELPMLRQDIADYLGLTIETVSRSLSALENNASIEIWRSRRVVLRNRAALRSARKRAVRKQIAPLSQGINVGDALVS